MALEEREAFDPEIVNLYIQGKLSAFPALEKNARFKAFIPAQIDNMVAQITTWCYSGRVPSRGETVEYCDSLWQLFKHKYFPEWLKNIWPVRYRKFQKEVHHYFVCPHLVTESQDVHVRFMTTARKSAGLRGDME